MNSFGAKVGIDGGERTVRILLAGTGGESPAPARWPDFRFH